MVENQRAAMVAFKVYLDRGKRARELMEQGSIDKATEVLKRRDAAYHNFLAYEQYANDNGTPLERDPTFLQLWQEIEEENEKLQELILSACEGLKTEFNETKRARTGIAKYRSGSAIRSAFEQAV